MLQNNALSTKSGMGKFYPVKFPKIKELWFAEFMGEETCFLKTHPAYFPPFQLKGKEVRSHLTDQEGF